MSDKTLCKLVKKDFLKEHLDEYVNLVKNGGYVCKKCGRTACNEKILCKAVSMGMVAMRRKS